MKFIQQGNKAVIVQVILIPNLDGIDRGIRNQQLLLRQIYEYCVNIDAQKFIAIQLFYYRREIIVQLRRNIAVAGEKGLYGLIAA